MIQVLAIYPKNEVEFFNSFDISVNFVTVENVYKNINQETCCIVVKDNKSGQVLRKIRENFIALPVVLVDSDLEKDAVDNRTVLIDSARLAVTLKNICRQSVHFFSDAKLDQEVQMLQKFNINTLLSTQKGFYGELLAEYLANKSDLIVFDMSKKDENHLISELSAVMSQKKFLTIYISNFESILTMLSVLEWFSANKTVFSRAIFHLENRDWLDNLPKSIFNTIYTLQIPDLSTRPADLWSIINSYAYQYLTKDFIQHVLNTPMSEQELLDFLKNSFDNKTFTL